MVSSFGPVLPQNPEAEEAVLGSLLLSPAQVRKTAPIVHEEHFLRPKNALIFQTIKTLVHQGSVADVLTVISELEKNGRLEAAGGADYIKALVEAVPNAENAAYYAGLVREASMSRSMITAGNQIAALGYDQTQPLNERIAASRSLLSDLTTSDVATHPVGIAAYQIKADIEQRKLHGTPIGLPLGYVHLDKVIHLQTGNLMIVAGRPSTGKSSISLCFASNIAKRNEAVGILSLEMTTNELTLRLVSMQSGLSTNVIQEGGRNPKEALAIDKAFDEVTQWPIFINDRQNHSLASMSDFMATSIMANKCKIIIVDYLGLIRLSNARENRNEELGTITASLRASAKDMGVPIIALHQLSRAIESRDLDKDGQKSFRLSDLRDSGNIEQDAHVVAFVDNMTKNNPAAAKPITHKGVQYDRARLVIAKNRSGPLDSIPLMFRGETTEFIADINDPDDEEIA